jgi:hypothetical protein
MDQIRKTAQICIFLSSQPQLRFSGKHGENCQILRDGTHAKRTESFCKGIVFSDRPVECGERVCIRLTELSIRWSGVLRCRISPIVSYLDSHLINQLDPDMGSTISTKIKANWLTGTIAMRNSSYFSVVKVTVLFCKTLDPDLRWICIPILVLSFP